MLENLKMATVEEVADIINVSKDTMQMLREEGLLEATKTGKCYMYSQEEILRFQRDYKGFDVSNRVKAREAKEKVTAGTVTNENINNKFSSLF